MTTQLDRTHSDPALQHTAVPPPARSKSWWGDRGIKTKILTAVTVPIVGAVTIGVMGIAALGSASDSLTEVYEGNLIGITHLADVRASFSNMRTATLRSGLAKTAEDEKAFAARFDAAAAELDAAVVAYESTDAPAAQREQLATIVADVHAYAAVQHDVLAPLLAAGDQNGWAAAREEQAVPISNKADAEINELFQIEQAGAAEFVETVKASAATTTTTNIIVLVVAAILSVLLGLLVAGGVGKAARKVLDVLTALAKGDLTRSTGLTTQDEMGKMGVALDDASANLRSVMATVVGGADAVAASSEELSASSTQISAAAEETSAQAGVVAAASEQVSTNVQTVSAASEQMAASIQEIAANAADAATVAGRGVEAAKSTSAVMRKLDDSSGEIGKVISLITSIADQTNLLALNATIEAARAGESGKGFAVVANEVKELAQESAKAASEISRLVEGIQHDTGDAVTAIGEISEIITQISDRQATIASAVEEQTATTHEITRSVSEAATGAGEIASNVTGVSTAAESTTEALGQAGVAIAELSRMAADLRGTVSQFTY